MYPDYASWTFPTADNPLVTAKDIEEARQTLPLDVFKQEYEAEFLDDMTGVFRNVKACTMTGITANVEPIKGTARYFAGLDLARLTDFSVLIILDQTGKQVYFDRFNILDWKVQIAKVVPVVKKYNAKLFVDSTGVGDPIFEALRDHGLDVHGITFNNENKKQLIQNLMLGFEQTELNILDIEVMLNEIGIFEYEMLPSGRVRYAAPEGYHDDCVIALALAYWSYSHAIFVTVALSEKDIY